MFPSSVSAGGANAAAPTKLAAPASPKGKGKGKGKPKGLDTAPAGGARVGDPTAPASPGGKRGTAASIGGGGGGGAKAKAKAKKGKRAVGGGGEGERGRIEKIDLSGDVIDIDVGAMEVDPQEAKKKKQEEQRQQLQHERAWMGGAWGKDEDHRIELDEVPAGFRPVNRAIDLGCAVGRSLFFFCPPAPPPSPETLPYDVHVRLFYLLL